MKGTEEFKKEDCSVYINQIKINVLPDFKKQYEIYRLKSDLKVYGDIMSLANAQDNRNIVSVCYEQNNNVLVLMKKRPGGMIGNQNRTWLEDTCIRKNKDPNERGHLSIDGPLDSAELSKKEPYKIIRLATNACAYLELKNQHFSNVSGKCYCIAEDMYTKSGIPKKDFTVTEIKISPESCMTAHAVNFKRIESPADAAKWDRPLYILSSYQLHRCTNTSRPLSDNEFYCCPKGKNGTRVSQTYLNVASEKNVYKSKMNVIWNTLSDMRFLFEGSINFDVNRIQPIHRYKLKEKGSETIRKKEINRFLDFIGPFEIANLTGSDSIVVNNREVNLKTAIEDTFHVLEETSIIKGASFTFAKEVPEDGLPVIAVIHGPDYYEEHTDEVDPYRHDYSVPVQHVLTDSFGKESMSPKKKEYFEKHNLEPRIIIGKSAAQAILYNLGIKKEVRTAEEHPGFVSEIMNWKGRKPKGDWYFFTPITIYPRTVKKGEQKSEIYIGFFRITPDNRIAAIGEAFPNGYITFDEKDSKNPKILLFSENSEDRSACEYIFSKLLESRNESGKIKQKVIYEFAFLADDGSAWGIRDSGFTTLPDDGIKQYLKGSKKPGLKTLAFQNGFELKGEEPEGDQHVHSVSEFREAGWWKEPDQNLFHYYIGESSGDIKNGVISNAIHIRNIEPLNEIAEKNRHAERIIKMILPQPNEVYIRNNRISVLPFPAKFCREYILDLDLKLKERR